MTVELEVVDAAGFAAWVDPAVDIYAAALHRPADVIPSRRISTREHLDEPGFRAVLARAEGELVGFGYGYDELPGQWWHEIVVDALNDDVVARWLSDAFQVTELHVLPAHQGHGIGRQVLQLLLADVGRRTAVLSAFDEPTPARALYRSLGFVDLLTGLRFPGNIELYAVMAAELPLRDRG